MDDVTLFDSKGRKIQSTRNMIFSEPLRSKMPKPTWTNWTVKKAVKDGLKSSVWIYRSFGLISSSAAGVELKVVNKEDRDHDTTHPLNQVLSMPNKQVSRKDCFTLIYMWLLLTGLAYFRKATMTNSQGRFYLWPVSPDRIVPVRDNDIDMMIKGYIKSEDKVKAKNLEMLYEPEEIIAFKIMDPANPLLGMSPLLAAAKVIDTDIEQQNFNKSAMQNRGVLDGLITFDDPLQPEQINALAEKWGERHQGADKARNTAFMGSKAKYHRMSMTPAEADFGTSRKNNRDEILSAVGTPPQLVGAQEASTMDNFRTSEIIHWRNTIQPLVDIVVSQMNFFFSMSGDLADDKEVAPDYSNIQALQQNFESKTKAADKLFKIGVPVETISGMLKLGIEEYEGWELSYNGRDVKINPATGERTALEKETTEGDVEDKTGDGKGKRSTLEHPSRMQVITRALVDEVDKLAQASSKKVHKILKKEERAIEEILGGDDPVRMLGMMFEEEDPFGNNDDWAKVLTKTAETAGNHSGNKIVIGQRGFEDDLAKAITAALIKEGVTLKEVSLINAATSDMVITVIKDGADVGASIGDMKKALNDTGVFSAERALRISRTVAGTGSSVGQLTAADMSGAKRKVWMTSGGNVREWHSDRNGEEVAMDARFARVQAPSGGAYPRYPLDPEIAPEDRINCRCSMTFI